MGAFSEYARSTWRTHPGRARELSGVETPDFAPGHDRGLHYRVARRVAAASHSPSSTNRISLVGRNPSFSYSGRPSLLECKITERMRLARHQSSATSIRR